MTFNLVSEDPTTGSAPDSRAEVAALLDRYLLTLDDEELDEAWAAGLFTQDAVVAFPMNRHTGIDGMAAYHRRALSAFAATQHLGSPALVVLDRDRASLRANLMSTHVHHARHARPQGTGPRSSSQAHSSTARHAAPRRGGT
ncbi:nuclear transport factor 2 family protein [Streptomyces sp. M10(2022)]